MFEWCNR